MRRAGWGGRRWRSSSHLWCSRSRGPSRTQCDLERAPTASIARTRWHDRSVATTCSVSRRSRCSSRCSSRSRDDGARLGERLVPCLADARRSSTGLRRVCHAGRSLFQLVLELTFAVLLLSGLRRASARRLVLAGVPLGVAIFSRPADVLFFAVPFLALFAYTYRHHARLLARRAALVAVGAAPAVSA